MRDLSSDSTYTDTIKYFGIVQHAYLTSIIGMRHNLEAVIETLGPDPFERMTASEQAAYSEELLPQESKSLYSDIKLISEESLTKDHSDRFLAPLWYQQKFLRPTVAGLNWGELLPARLKVAMNIAELCFLWSKENDISPTLKELINRIAVRAKNLERLSLLVILYRMVGDLYEIGEKVRLFQDFSTAVVRHNLPADDYDLGMIVKEAMSSLTAYAHKKGVRFDYHFKSGKYPIKGSRHELVRAFSNVIHNAIKYSWVRNNELWIRVEISKTLANGQSGYTVFVENYGVGITREELIEETIYRFGYRGVYSGLQDRVGMGTGLPDSRWVFERYGGKIAIDSFPASRPPKGVALKLFPHLTRVNIFLPESPQKKETEINK